MINPTSAIMAVGRRSPIGAIDEDRPAYRRDLDGLRAVAVGLVILTHARWPWTNNGGDMGVTAFFVLSGYLITSILVGQQARTGRIAIISFYRRRFIRLAPALLGLMAFTLIFGLIFGWPTRWQIGLISCLAYVSNWVQVADIDIDPLGHTWSLAIEEQYYLIWPAILIVLRGRILTIAVIGIVLASALRIIATGPLEYFSTFTRADAILTGCVVAILRPQWHPSVAFGGAFALVAVALIDPVHDIAIPAAMAATVAVIGGRFEGLGVLAPVGLRAYSLYLWNWPLTLLFGTFGPLATLLTFLIGEVSYRLLEAPVLHRGRARAARSSGSPIPSVGPPE